MYKTDRGGIRTHALSDWCLKPAPLTARPLCRYTLKRINYMYSDRIYDCSFLLCGIYEGKIKIFIFIHNIVLMENVKYLIEKMVSVCPKLIAIILLIFVISPLRVISSQEL